MVDYTQVMYGAESQSDDSGRPNSRRSSYRKKSQDSNGKSRVPSRQGSRAKSVSLGKVSRAADTPTKSPGKTAASIRGSRSNGRVSFAEIKSVSPSPSAESPRYSPPPAHRPSINIFTKEPLESPGTPGNSNFDLNGSRRPSEYIFADRNPPLQSPESPPIKRSPQFKQSAPFNKSHQASQSAHSPQISPNTVNPPGNYLSTTETSPGIPNRSASSSIDIVRRPSVYPFLPMDQIANYHSSSVPSTPKSNKISSSRRASGRPPRRGTQGAHHSIPDDWKTRRQSSNFFLNYSKTSTPNTPNMTATSPPPPPSDPPPMTPPVPSPPPFEDPMTSPAPKTTDTKSKRKSVVNRSHSQDIAKSPKSPQPPTLESYSAGPNESLLFKPAMSYDTPKGFEKPKKKKNGGVANLRKASRSSIKSRSTLRSRRVIPWRDWRRAPPAGDAPSRNTRAAALERKRRGQKPLARGTRFGYEALEQIEAETRAVRKSRRERKMVERELRVAVAK